LADDPVAAAITGATVGIGVGDTVVASVVSDNATEPSSPPLRSLASCGAEPFDGSSIEADARPFADRDASDPAVPVAVSCVAVCAGSRGSARGACGALF
jgi:hypothetical protein